MFLIICNCGYKFTRKYPSNPKTQRPYRCPRRKVGLTLVEAIAQNRAHRTRLSSMVEQLSWSLGSKLGGRS